MADLAEKIAQIAPRGLTKTFFANSGAEAIEGAMKLARLYSGKHEFIALKPVFTDAHGERSASLAIKDARSAAALMRPVSLLHRRLTHIGHSGRMILSSVPGIVRSAWTT